MIISLIFVALSGLMGVGMYFLVIGIVFSAGGGGLLWTATDYNQLSFYIVLLVVCLVICFSLQNTC